MRLKEFISREYVLVEYERHITAEKLGQKIIARGESDDLDQILSQMEDADPTPNKQYMEWIARRYVAGDFLLEDLSVVRQYLQKFIESRKLIQNKDINSYSLKTLKELIQGIYKSDNNEKDKDISVLYPILPDTRVLYNGPEGQLVIPLTTKASQALQKIGKPSEWCTADSRAPTHFPTYSQRGPLYVWIDKSGNKWQFYFPSKQYMDQFDNKIGVQQAREMLFKHPVLSRYMPGLITDLTLLPPEMLTYERCLAAVQNDGWALFWVPEPLRDVKMCLTAVSNNGEALGFVPVPLRDVKMCLTAVQNNGEALRLVPKPLRDVKMCLTAVSNNGLALGFVPVPLRDEKMCLTAVQNDGWALDDVPEPLLDLNMCLAAVQQNGRALDDVPEPLRDLNMCLTAVQNNGGALQSVPKPLRDVKVCLAAVSNYGQALFWVPEPLRDEKMCLTAVSNDGEALFWVPKPLRDLNMCLTAVKNNGRALRDVPPKLQSIIKQKLNIQ